MEYINNNNATNNNTVVTAEKEKEKEKDLVNEYISQMTEREKKAYKIATGHLKTSFNILLSNGFKTWKKSRKPI